MKHAQLALSSLIRPAITESYARAATRCAFSVGSAINVGSANASNMNVLLTTTAKSSGRTAYS